MPFNSEATPNYPHSYRTDPDFARQLDGVDPLRGYRDQFLIPRQPDGRPVIYFCSQSLGLQPRGVRALMDQELTSWAQLGVEGHFHGKTPWYTYQDLVRASMARHVGARPDEVILMNGLTVNIHLMLETFYRPCASRYLILMDDPPFPSDLYAVQSQLRRHGYDPTEALVTQKPRAGEHTVRHEDVEAILAQRGQQIALVLWNGVNFLTGQAFDLPRIATAARKQGCVVGLDLAHAVGNIPLRLHDWPVDFAVWCTYKYLNSGPGAIAGCFVHESHGRNLGLPRLAGWWGNDPATRFRMQLQPDFIPQLGAGGWQVSNPSILALVPLRAALAQFDEVGMAWLRAKSECLTGYLEYLLAQLPGKRFEVVTPRELKDRGCQLSILVHDRPRDRLQALEEQGVSADFREPNVIRVAPVPFYNTFEEVWNFVQILAQQLDIVKPQIRSDSSSNRTSSRELETERLHLRPFRPDDLDSLHAVYSDAEVMHFIGKGKALTREETRTRLAAIIEQWEQHSFGRWAVMEKSTGKLIGRCGLSFLDGTKVIELGYVIARRCWGQGLSAEAAAACLHYGFEQAKLDRIVAIAQPANLASQRVMQKVGLKYEKLAYFYDTDVVYYALSRQEYMAGQMHQGV